MSQPEKTLKTPLQP